MQNDQEKAIFNAQQKRDLAGPWPTFSLGKRQLRLKDTTTTTTTAKTQPTTLR